MKDYIVLAILIYLVCNLHNIHDWICVKLSNLSLMIFRR